MEQFLVSRSKAIGSTKRKLLRQPTCGFLMSPDVFITKPEMIQERLGMIVLHLQATERTFLSVHRTASLIME